MKKILTITLTALLTIGLFVSCSAETVSTIFDTADGNLLPGVFTVNAEGKQVQFTKGNLWADATDSENIIFHLEENQYSINRLLGDYNSGEETYEEVRSHLGHFYYSSQTSIACSESYRGSSVQKTNDEVLFTNGTETTVNPNFTVEGKTGKYRSLSAEELVWLLGPKSTGLQEPYTAVPGTTCRTTICTNVTSMSNARYAIAKITSGSDTIRGIIIFPDVYTNPEGINFDKGVNVFNIIYDISVDDLKKLEDAGCVFLVDSGIRTMSGYISYRAGDEFSGALLTSSPCELMINNRWALTYGGMDVGYAGRQNGSNIRLVADCEK